MTTTNDQPRENQRFGVFCSLQSVWLVYPKDLRDDLAQTLRAGVAAFGYLARQDMTRLAQRLSFGAFADIIERLAMPAEGADPRAVEVVRVLRLIQGALEAIQEAA